MQYRGDDEFTELRGWFSRLLDQAGWFDQELADSQGGDITGTSHCTAAHAECRGTGTVEVRARSMSFAETGLLFGRRRRRRPIRVVGRSWLTAAAPIMRAVGHVVNPIAGASMLRASAARIRGRMDVNRTPVDEEESPLVLGVF